MLVITVITRPGTTTINWWEPGGWINRQRNQLSVSSMGCQVQGRAHGDPLHPGLAGCQRSPLGTGTAGSTGDSSCCCDARSRFTKHGRCFRGDWWRMMMMMSGLNNCYFIFTILVLFLILLYNYHYVFLHDDDDGEWWVDKLGNPGTSLAGGFGRGTSSHVALPGIFSGIW